MDIELKLTVTEKIDNKMSICKIQNITMWFSSEVAFWRAARNVSLKNLSDEQNLTKQRFLVFCWVQIYKMVFNAAGLNRASFYQLQKRKNNGLLRCADIYH